MGFWYYHFLFSNTAVVAMKCLFKTVNWCIIVPWIVSVYGMMSRINSVQCPTSQFIHWLIANSCQKWTSHMDFIFRYIYFATNLPGYSKRTWGGIFPTFATNEAYVNILFTCMLWSICSWYHHKFIQNAHFKHQIIDSGLALMRPCNVEYIHLYIWYHKVILTDSYCIHTSYILSALRYVSKYSSVDK